MLVADNPHLSSVIAGRKVDREDQAELHIVNETRLRGSRVGHISYCFYFVACNAMQLESHGVIRTYMNMLRKELHKITTARVVRVDGRMA